MAAAASPADPADPSSPAVGLFDATELAAERSAAPDRGVDASDSSQGWRGRSFRSQCECERCKRGETNHNDASHSQSLFATLQLRTAPGASLIPINLIGGSTKCARVMCNYFSRDLGAEHFAGRSVVELGAGTGLVGTCLAHLGATVRLTDQEGVLELLQHNVDENVAKTDAESRVSVSELLWGPNVGTLGARVDDVVGSDLIYAHEAHKPLSEAFLAVCRQFPSANAYLAVVRRFDWEVEFFKLMHEHFSRSVAFAFDDIVIYRFNLRPATAEAGSPPTAAELVEEARTALSSAAAGSSAPAPASGAETR